MHCTMHLARPRFGINCAGLLIWRPCVLSVPGLRGQPEMGMTTFNKREEGFEQKFAHDEELRFRATARRNKLLGQWAAEKLGLSGAGADAYVKSVIKADLLEAGDEDVFRKIRSDFDAKGVDQSDHQIRRTMNELLGTAVEQIQSEG